MMESLKYVINAINYTQHMEMMTQYVAFVIVGGTKWLNT